jgi:hypothetical protein
MWHPQSSDLLHTDLICRDIEAGEQVVLQLANVGVAGP